MPTKRIFRWIIYFLELLVFYVLQTTPGLIPAAAGVRPVLLIPAALTIALFEGDMGGLLVGITAGLLIDMGGDGVLGFHAILMAVFCFAIGALAMQILRTNLLVALLSVIVTVPVICILQWFFFYVIPGYAGTGYVFAVHYWPKMIYTVCTAPFLYLFNRIVALRLSEAA